MRRGFAWAQLGPGYINSFFLIKMNEWKGGEGLGDYRQMFSFVFDTVVTRSITRN